MLQPIGAILSGFQNILMPRAEQEVMSVDEYFVLLSCRWFERHWGREEGQKITCKTLI